MKQPIYQLQPQPNKKFHLNHQSLVGNFENKKKCCSTIRPQEACELNTFNLQSIENCPQKSIDIKERYENQASNYLRQISEDHWLVQNQNQTQQKYYSIKNPQLIDREHSNKTAFKPQKQPKNYLAFNKTCTLKQRPTTMYKHQFFQLKEKQQDKSSRYKQREAQTSMYFYESLNLKNTSDNVQQEQMFLNDFKKQQSKAQSFHGFINMKQTLRSKSEYYQKLKYHLFKTFQIDGKQLTKQNVKNKYDQSYTIQGNQFLTQSPATYSYFNKDSINSQRRQVYSSKKKISLDLSTLDAIHTTYGLATQNNLASIHSQLNRSKQLKLMQQQEYNYLQSKKDKKKVINNNNNRRQISKAKRNQVQANLNELDVNLNADIRYQQNSNKNDYKKKIRVNRSNKIDLSLMSKWDKINMRGKLWLGRPPIKIIQKMGQSREE